MRSKKLLYTVIVLLIVVMGGYLFLQKTMKTPSTDAALPLVVIANYGPHSSLTETVVGLKHGLAEFGFQEDVSVRFKEADVNFDPSLIPQMLATFKAQHPAVVVALTTPVAQAAKNTFSETPIVFSAITDPVEGGLITVYDQAQGNVTGAADRQDLALTLAFAKELLPRATRVGLLYATAEANDAALVKMMTLEASKQGLDVVAIPIDQARDIPMRMQGFKDRVDFIYVGTSGPTQPALPTIAAEADRMRIPVINSDTEAVKSGLVLASYGVNYAQVGRNTAIIVARLLSGESVSAIAPIYPAASEHYGIISQKQASLLKTVLPTQLEHVTIVE